MTHEVHELKENESAEKCHLNVVISPGRWRVLWMYQEINGPKAHEYPVMRTILEDIEERHGVIRESVNKESLKLTLHVMTDNHGKTELLIECIRLRLPINLL